MTGSDRPNGPNPRARLELAERAFNEALRAAHDAAWRQAPALLEIVGPRSRRECAKILTPLIHHHYEGFKTLSEEDRRLIYRELVLLLKRAAPDLTDEQIGQLLAKPLETFHSSRTGSLEYTPEMKGLQELVTSLTWEYQNHLLATFEPSPALLAIAGRQTRRRYLGILQTVRTAERYRQIPPPPESGMLEQWLEESKSTLRAFAPSLTDAQVERLISTPYADLDPEGLAR